MPVGQTRYVTKTPAPETPNIGQYIAAGLGARLETAAEKKTNEDKAMATLIAQLAQVGMIKPGGKKGAEGTLSAYGQTYTVINKPEDVAENYTKFRFGQAQKEAGLAPMGEAEVTNWAIEQAQAVFNDPNWEMTKIRLRQESKGDEEKYAELLSAAQKSVVDGFYDSKTNFQKQYFPDYYKTGKESGGPSAEAIAAIAKAQAAKAKADSRRLAPEKTFLPPTPPAENVSQKIGQSMVKYPISLGKKFGEGYMDLKTSMIPRGIAGLANVTGGMQSAITGQPMPAVPYQALMGSKDNILRDVFNPKTALEQWNQRPFFTPGTAAPWGSGLNLQEQVNRGMR